jgi:hypothetical protein
MSCDESLLISCLPLHRFPFILQFWVFCTPFTVQSMIFFLVYILHFS